VIHESPKKTGDQGICYMIVRRNWRSGNPLHDRQKKLVIHESPEKTGEQGICYMIVRKNWLSGNPLHDRQKKLAVGNASSPCYPISEISHPKTRCRFIQRTVSEPAAVRNPHIVFTLIIGCIHPVTPSGSDYL